MEYNITIRKVNSSYVQIDAEQSILYELSEHFTFYVPGAHFTPQYRNKIWDGKIRLLDTRNRTLYFGLLYDVVKFCKKNNYSFYLHNSLDLINHVTIEQIKEYTDSLNIHSKNQKITLREDQIKAIYHAIKYKKCLILSPTSSGKSVIAYCVVRWILENQDVNKILIVVPTIQLVSQLAGDFADYSSHDDWNADEMIHEIFSGEEKNSTKNIIISTWQSIYKLDKRYFSKFDAVIGDEAHRYTAKSIKNILEQSINASYRIGMTGTLDDTKTHELVLQGLFGPVKKMTTTKELMDNKHVSNLRIKGIQLCYKNQDNRSLCELKYKDEIKFIKSHEKRLKFICELAMSQELSVLILFDGREYGKNIYHYLKKNNRKNKELFYVDGLVSRDSREDTKNSIENARKNSIIVASYGTYSTGINIKNLNVLIFATPSKSKIRILQSIGRILRKGEDTNVVGYDIADDFSYKEKKNYSLKHFLIRIEYYIREQFDFKILKMEI